MMERIAESRRASTESVRRERERSAPLNPPQHNRLTFPIPPVTQAPDRAPVVPAPRPIGPPAPLRFPTPPKTPACAISRGLAPSSSPATPCSMPRRRGPYRRSPFDLENARSSERPIPAPTRQLPLPLAENR